MAPLNDRNRVATRAMGEWLRNTPWRQGSILSAESAKQLGSSHSDQSKETVVMVVSHDCDLAQSIENEPVCEAVVGFTIDKLDGRYGWAKSARGLHLSFSAGRVALNGDFVAIDKIQIPKIALADHVPAENVRLNYNEFTILQKWLALRYRRASFPEAFERRLDKLHDKILKALTGTESNIVSLYFDVDQGKDVERVDADDTYDLSIYIVHSADTDQKTAMAAATRIQQALTQSFRNVFYKNGKWQEIELRVILPVSEEAITARQARRFKQWNIDHLVLRAGAQEEPTLNPSATA